MSELQTATGSSENKTEYKMEVRGCPNCGQNFRTWVKSNQVFCSNLCRQDSGLKNPKPKKKEPWESLHLERAELGEGVTHKEANPIKRFEDRPVPKVDLPIPNIINVIKQTPPNIIDVIKPETSISSTSKEEAKIEVLTDEALDKRWTRYVAEAKPYIIGMQKARMEVAKIAIAACDIQWGGGNHWKKFEGVFTLKRFAEEIGVNSKTLSEWCAVRRLVYDKLPEGVWVDRDYMAACRTRKKVSRTSSPEEVARHYTDEVGRDQMSYYFIRAVSRLKTTRHMIFKKANLDELDIEEVREMRDICREIEQRLTKHLDTKEK